MNKDQVSGKTDQAVGKVKQSVGEAMGDEELANNRVADLDDTRNKVKDKIEELKERHSS